MYEDVYNVVLPASLLNDSRDHALMLNLTWSETAHNERNTLLESLFKRLQPVILRFVEAFREYGQDAKKSFRDKFKVKEKSYRTFMTFAKCLLCQDIYMPQYRQNTGQHFLEVSLLNDTLQPVAGENEFKSNSFPPFPVKLIVSVAVDELGEDESSKRTTYRSKFFDTKISGARRRRRVFNEETEEASSEFQESTPSIESKTELESDEALIDHRLPKPEVFDEDDAVGAGESLSESANVAAKRLARVDVDDLDGDNSNGHNINEDITDVDKAVVDTAVVDNAVLDNASIDKTDDDNADDDNANDDNADDSLDDSFSDNPFLNSPSSDRKIADLAEVRPSPESPPKFSRTMEPSLSVSDESIGTESHDHSRINESKRTRRRIGRDTVDRIQREVEEEDQKSAMRVAPSSRKPCPPSKSLKLKMASRSTTSISHYFGKSTSKKTLAEEDSRQSQESEKENCEKRDDGFIPMSWSSDSVEDGFSNKSVGCDSGVVEVVPVMRNRKRNGDDCPNGGSNGRKRLRKAASSSSEDEDEPDGKGLEDGLEQEASMVIANYEGDTLYLPGTLGSCCRSETEPGRICLGCVEKLLWHHRGLCQQIRRGKCSSRRHDDFQKGGKSRSDLDYQNHAVRVFTEEQQDLAARWLRRQFCSDGKSKRLDYVIRVLTPEILIRIFMDVTLCSYDEAEPQMKALSKPFDVDL